MTTKAAPKPMELPVAKLRWTCELSRIPFETTAQAELREGFIGQERALRALKMGAELSAPGYNVFVCGLAGTSRGGTIARMVEELHPPTKESLDRCYVNNFKLTDRPRLLALPRSSDSFVGGRSEEHTSELQSRPHLVCRLLLEKKKNIIYTAIIHEVQ